LTDKEHIMDRCPRWIAALACVAAAFSGSAAAQTARSGGGASAQLVQQLQQLASERTALQGENEKLKTQLAEVTKDRDALKASHQTVERRAKDAATALAQSNTQREAVDQELTQNKAKMQELIAKFRETIQTLRQTETAHAADKQTLATRERELAVCVDRNVALYRLNDEVLTRLDKIGFWSKAALAEPFTRIKRTQNENLVDDYRSRAQEQRVAPPAAPAASAATAAPTSPGPPPTAAPPSKPPLR
jgi:chromosome segregation ATPase